MTYEDDQRILQQKIHMPGKGEIQFPRRSKIKGVHYH